MVASSQFASLGEEQFRVRMRPHALEIYQKVWPGCSVLDLTEANGEAHVLDKAFGIDAIATLKTGQFVTLQEKYRANEFLVGPRYKGRADFTQEFMDAAGTPQERPGEWFHLASQFYFYGWSNSDKTGFEKWAILNVAAYKMLVEDAGGLSQIGTLKQNEKCGRASFYCIPMARLEPAIYKSYRDYW